MKKCTYCKDLNDETNEMRTETLYLNPSGYYNYHIPIRYCSYCGKIINKYKKRMENKSMGADPVFKIGDSVWTSELSNGDGWYHTFNRTVKYIKNKPNGTVYGFVYDIECTEDQCFHTKGMANFATETWNNRLMKKVIN